ncbi:ring-H2 finger domain-containing protein [Cryptosporidium ubiquitum]|uniref:RING-type E3 ubiquitin transferase n=1 Tax=Cryptosporidium ubiquitum TaxID=857276 RepID=A0A1J4MP22_9CRYT|nr:ring-H2 finger domain-containing protein [Cryptosporidium ubiquitum]OII74621.1 ring-H2 finger domain-containing protein [Cryptosporidium ubiquitum]
MESNSSRPGANEFYASIFDQINSLELSIPNFSAERNSRNLFFTFFLFFVILILVFQNKFEGNGSFVVSSTVSSSVYYFGEFQMNTDILNYDERIRIKDGLYTEYRSMPAIYGNSRWQLDWTKSSTASKSAWISLIIQLDENGKFYSWNFEKVVTEDDSNMVFRGKVNEVPTKKILNSNSTNCILEIDISDDTNLFNQIFPERKSEKYHFRGSSVNEKGIVFDKMEYVIKSLDCNFEVTLKGSPFSMSLFRLNIIHFSFLYNLKVLMEIRGSVTQLVHSNSPTIGSNYVNNTSISCLTMQIILDLLESVFILYCSFALPSLLFSSFTLMILFKWIHIFFIEIKYLFWIWKSNYLQNTPIIEMPTITAQFYRRLYLFLFGIVFFFILLFRICDPSEVFNIVTATTNKKVRIITQSIPYCFYLSLFFFLIPQIINDAFFSTNNSTSSSLPLHPHFILTSLIGKAFVPIYIWGYSNSIFNTPLFQYLNVIPISTKNSTLMSIFILSIASIQMMIYFFQLKFGPKCLIPKILRPKPYNYFRLTDKNICNEISIEEDSLEVNIPTINELKTEVMIGSKVEFIPDTSNTQSSGFEEIELTSFNSNKRHTNRLCVICMVNVSIFNDFDHELCAVCTPCDHIFHQKCLKQWMNVKLECPTCRRQIPPFESKQ